MSLLTYSKLHALVMLVTSAKDFYVTMVTQQCKNSKPLLSKAENRASNSKL
jgi:hypothetical protein